MILQYVDTEQFYKITLQRLSITNYSKFCIEVSKMENKEYWQTVLQEPIVCGHNVTKSRLYIHVTQSKGVETATDFFLGYISYA